MATSANQIEGMDTEGTNIPLPEEGTSSGRSSPATAMLIPGGKRRMSSSTLESISEDRTDSNAVTSSGNVASDMVYVTSAERNLTGSDFFNSIESVQWWGSVALKEYWNGKNFAKLPKSLTNMNDCFSTGMNCLFILKDGMMATQDRNRRRDDFEEGRSEPRRRRNENRESELIHREAVNKVKKQQMMVNVFLSMFGGDDADMEIINNLESACGFLTNVGEIFSKLAELTKAIDNAKDSEKEMANILGS